MLDIFTVIVNESAKRDLQTVPLHIARKLGAWIDAVGHDGILKIRKIPGFHDEPLKGSRRGQRSIRLNKAYRAIYVTDKIGEIEIVEVIEENKHDY